MTLNLAEALLSLLNFYHNAFSCAFDVAILQQVPNEVRGQSRRTYSRKVLVIKC